MKLNFKKLITTLVVSLCICLLCGTGYTVAKYTGVFDAGSFFLSLISTAGPPLLLALGARKRWHSLLSSANLPLFAAIVKCCAGELTEFSNLIQLYYR